MTKVVFAHGLEGSPDGYKATYLKEQFGATSPRLGELGLSGQSKALIDAMNNELCVLVGSSLGALAAWGAAAQRPELIKHLILLAPAIGGDRLAVDNPEIEARRPGLSAEVAAYGNDTIPAELPTTIIHGFEDELLALSDIVALARRSQSARLILIHADHSLVVAKDLICHEIRRVL